jgi:hypothetical protein
MCSVILAAVLGRQVLQVDLERSYRTGARSDTFFNTRPTLPVVINWSLPGSLNLGIHCRERRSESSGVTDEAWWNTKRYLYQYAVSVYLRRLSSIVQRLWIALIQLEQARVILSLFSPKVAPIKDQNCGELFITSSKIQERDWDSKSLPTG